MYKKSYNFHVTVRAKSTVFKSGTKAIIEDDLLKLQMDHETTCTIKKLKNYSGEYNIKNIKKISYSSAFIGITPLLLILLFFMIGIVAYSQKIEMLNAVLIVLGMLFIFCRVRTIKISFIGNNNIHIPIAELFKNLQTMQYGEEIEEFMNDILLKINNY